MLLIGVKEENNWLSSRWNLTYPAGWQQICRAVYSVYDFYRNPEVLANGKIIEIKNKEDILKLDEQKSLTVRGSSDIIRCPLMITFYNQLQTVDAAVPCMVDEFKTADYERFNMSLGQYMDSIELAMYR